MKKFSPPNMKMSFPYTPTPLYPYSYTYPSNYEKTHPKYNSASPATQPSKLFSAPPPQASHKLKKIVAIIGLIPFVLVMLGLILLVLSS